MPCLVRSNVNGAVRFVCGLRDPSDIVASAKKRLGETEYNVVTKNCQHFATECRYGQSRSTEVDIETHLSQRCP